MRAVFHRIEEIVCVIALSIMTILAFANVISRYVFSASFSFSEELTTYLFVLLSLIGAAVAARRGAHLGFTAIADAVSPPLRTIFHKVGFALATAFSAALFYYGCRMVMSQMHRGQVTAGMQWPEWVFGAFVPIGAFFIAVEFLTLLLRKEGDRK